MAKPKGGGKWIQAAIKHPGAATRKAKKAGMGVQEWATAHQHAKGTTGKQARLAKTLKKIGRNR
jgi:hypothetical protein